MIAKLNIRNFKFLFLTQVLFSFFISSAFSQPIDAPKKKIRQFYSPEIGTRNSIGFLFVHSAQMAYLVQGQFKSTELYLERAMNGKHAWQEAYRIPTVGLNFLFADMGNKTNMGYAYSISIYLKNHLIKRKHFEFNTRICDGIAWLTKHYDRFSNNKNSAIAGGFNANLAVGLDLEYRNKNFDIGLGFNFIHFSNGAFKVPNLGYNFPTIGLNLGYKLNNNEPHFDPIKAKKEFLKSNRWEVVGAIGWKEIMPSTGPKYFVPDINGGWSRKFNIKSSFLTFAELNYNRSYTISYENWNKTTADKITGLRAGVGIGYGIMLGKFMLYIHDGVYVIDPLRYDTFMFSRIGSRYYFKNGLVANFSLRTHFAKADVVEAGIGWCWQKNRK